jgi:hypothetical protein
MLVTGRTSSTATKSTSTVVGNVSRYCLTNEGLVADRVYHKSGVFMYTLVKLNTNKLGSLEYLK